MLQGLDVLVIDLQDVGTRIYTYIYTMAYCLRAAERPASRSIVCDRPNPIGGVSVEGPMLDARVRILRRPLSDPDAARHDDRRMARLFNEHFGIGAEPRSGPDGRLEARTCIR